MLSRTMDVCHWFTIKLEAPLLYKIVDTYAELLIKSIHL